MSQKCVFLKCTFLGPQLSRRGLVWYFLNSWKARAPHGRPAGARASRGLDNQKDILSKDLFWTMFLSKNKKSIYCPGGKNQRQLKECMSSCQSIYLQQIKKKQKLGMICNQNLPIAQHFICLKLFVRLICHSNIKYIFLRVPI